MGWTHGGDEVEWKTKAGCQIGDGNLALRLEHVVALGADAVQPVTARNCDDQYISVILRAVLKFRAAAVGCWHIGAPGDELALHQVHVALVRQHVRQLHVNVRTVHGEDLKPSIA